MTGQEKRGKGREGRWATAPNTYFWLQHCDQWWPCIYLARLWRYHATNILGLLLPLLLLCRPVLVNFCSNSTNFVAMATRVGCGRLTEIINLPDPQNPCRYLLHMPCCQSWRKGPLVPMLTHLKLTIHILSMLRHMSSGHVTLLQGEF